MLVLARHDGQFVSSARMAESLGTNPVTVRRLLGRLVDAGLVQTQTGPGGGARLNRPPTQITVDDVFEAVGRPAFVRGQEREPARCDIAECVPRVLDRLNDAIEAKAAPIMRRTTLQKLLKEELD